MITRPSSMHNLYSQSVSEQDMIDFVVLCIANIGTCTTISTCVMLKLFYLMT